MLKIFLFLFLFLSCSMALGGEEEDKEHMPAPTPESKNPGEVPFLATYIPATERPTLPEPTPFPTEVTVGSTPNPTLVRNTTEKKGLQLTRAAKYMEESGLARYILALHGVTEVAKIQVVLTYPKEAVINRIPRGPGDKCTVTDNATDGNMTIDVVCDPVFSGNGKLAEWSVTSTVAPADIQVVSCALNDVPNSCTMGKH